MLRIHLETGLVKMLNNTIIQIFFYPPSKPNAKATIILLIDYQNIIFKLEYINCIYPE